MLRSKFAVGVAGALRNYRVYRLDGAGKIMSAEWIEAPDDDAASSEAHNRNGGGKFELWDKDRLVERYRGAPPLS